MDTMRKAAVALGAAVLAAGCAGPRIDGQWSDPAFAQRSLGGSRVLVSCRGPDATLSRLCEERIAAELRASGVEPLRASAPLDPAAGGETVARAAREAGASAAVLSSISVAGVTSPGIGPTVGFGLGGGSFGGGGIGFGGVGLSVPFGGVRSQTSFASSTTVLDAATGREMWSVRVVNPGRDDAAVQVAELGRESVEQMRRTGLLGAAAGTQGGSAAGPTAPAGPWSR